MSRCQTASSVSDLTDLYLGAPFRRYGRDPETGIDCLGWVLLICREVHGVIIPDPESPDGELLPSLLTQFRRSLQPINLASVRTGDLFYCPGSDARQAHMGIYDCDDGWWSHATGELGIGRTQIRQWPDKTGVKFYALRCLL